MDKETSDAMGLIYESIDGSDISFDPITTDEALDIFRDNPSYHLLDRLNGRPGDDFYKTDHYAIMYDGRMVGVIGFADYNRTWYGHKDMWDPEWGRDVGKRALWIQILEIDQNIKKTFPSMSPVFLAVGTLAKLKEYCKENGFTRIMCGAIDSRTADFYRRGGFSGNSLLLSYTI